MRAKISVGVSVRVRMRVSVSVRVKVRVAVQATSGMVMVHLVVACTGGWENGSSSGVSNISSSEEHLRDILGHITVVEGEQHRMKLSITHLPSLTFTLTPPPPSLPLTFRVGQY